MIPTIETERLILRAPLEQDFPVYERFYADAEASARYGGPLPSNRAWHRLAADLGHWQLRGYGMWSVQERASGEMVGGCGLVWPQGWPRSELTFWIIPTARRKGIAFEASRAAVSFGYQTLKWDEVETHMNDENLPVVRLAEQLGGKIVTRILFPDGVERNIYALPQTTSQ